MFYPYFVCRYVLVPLKSGTRSYFQKCRNPSSVIGFRKNPIGMHTLVLKGIDVWHERVKILIWVYSTYFPIIGDLLAETDTVLLQSIIPRKKENNILTHGIEGSTGMAPSPTPLPVPLSVVTLPPLVAPLSFCWLLHFPVPQPLPLVAGIQWKKAQAQ